MAQRDVLILNESVPQIQVPQAGDTYRLGKDTDIVGNATVSGTLNGIVIALLGTALQPGANVSTLTNNLNWADDLTGAEIKALLFALADTNNYDDAAKAQVDQLAGPATQGEAEGGTNNTKWMTPLRVAQAIAVFSAGLLNKYDAVTNPGPTNDINDGYSVGSIWMNQATSEVYRCIDNAAATAVWIKTTLTVDELATVAVSGDSDDLTEGVVKLLMTSGERTKLAGIETGATADQTGAEIKALYEAQADTNAFTDALLTKLNGIEALADVTDAVNVEAAGALMDSELTDLAGVKAVTISTLQPKPTEGAFVDGDKTKLDGIESGATADQSAGEIEALLYTVTTGITAYAGGGQANAVELTTRYNHVGTVATTADSVKLPAAAAGLVRTVVNKGANAMDLFPGSGDDINGTGVDTAVSVAAGSSVTVWCADATNWYYE